MSDKIRKYVLPNLPYLFVFWFFSKIGTAYRIAPGTDFGTKLMGIKKIVFNFPVPVDGEEVKELPLETETTVETVALLTYAANEKEH